MVVVPRHLAFYGVLVFVIGLDDSGDAQTLYRQLGQSVEIPCYENGPTPVFSVALKLPGQSVSVSIYLNGNLTNNLSASKYPLDTSSFHVTVLDIGVSDAGEFECRSDNRVNFQFETFVRTLSVYSPPTVARTTIELENNEAQEVEADTEHRVKCKAVGVYPQDSVTFTILSGSTPVVRSTAADFVTDSSDTFTATLSRDVTFRSDYNTNKLKCQAAYAGPGNNNAEVTSLDLDVVVRYCDPLTIRTTNGVGSTPDAGTVVNIECTANCVPVRDIILYRIDSAELESELERVTRARSLTRDYTLRKEDNGLHFNCDAEGTRAESDIFYNVQFKATDIAATATPNAYVALGADITVDCLTDEANPTAAVEWSLSNVSPSNSEVTANSCCDAKRRKSIITIANVQRSNNGEDITCSVPDTSATATVTLSIAFYPSDVTFSFITSNTVKAGESITVQCVTESFHLDVAFTEMRWKIGNAHDNSGLSQYDDTMSSPIDGDYGEQTATSSYTFDTTPDHNGKYVTCVPRWGMQAQNDLKKSKMITVNFPPTVSVTGCGGDVDEGGNCELTCETTDGFPVQFTYTWEFKRKFGDNFAPLPHADAQYSISSLTYEHAGEYKCIVTNAGGREEGTKTVNVKYAPIAIGIFDNTVTFHAAEGDDVTLSLTVHSYPSPAHFTWRRGGTDVESDPTSDGNDQTQSNVEIQNANSDDFDDYSVQVQNGDRSLTSSFTVILELQGKPGIPRDFEVMSASYREIIFSFLPGLNGGFPQTLIVHPSSVDGDHTPVASEVRSDPDFGVRINVTLSDLWPLTNYTYFVSADNSYPGQRTETDRYTVTTRGKVEFDTDSLTYQVNGEEAELTWRSPEGPYYHTVLIHQCMEENFNCLDHNVTGEDEKRISIHNGTQFSIAVYQDLDEIYSAVFKKDAAGSDGHEGSNPAMTIGLVIGIFVALVFIAVLVIIILLKMRKKGGDDPKLNFDDIETHTASAPETSATYAAVDMSKKKKKNAGLAPDTSATYAAVDMSKKKKKNAAAAQEDTSVPYATVDKTKKTKKKKVPTATLR